MAIVKYLTFSLADEVYGLPIITVREIIGMMDITSIPGMPGFIKGVINLRGKIIPVMDLRLKFGFEGRDYDSRTSIIVVESASANGGKSIGCIVDSVREVQNIGDENISPPPANDTNKGNLILSGIGKVDAQVILLLNADEIACVPEFDINSTKEL